MNAPRWVLVVRVATASVWLAFGLFFKVFGWVPRHRDIVAAVVGQDVAGPLTLLIGCAEVVVAAWILSGWRPWLCAAAQTAAVVTMNALELAQARELLLAPSPMLAANVVLLAAAWVLAWRTARQPSAGSAGDAHGST